MPIVPVSPERLVEVITSLVTQRLGRVRLAVDGPPPTRPVDIAGGVAAALRERGRGAVVVAAADFLRPASVRLEFGREDPDEFLDGWLDAAALRREVLAPAAPDGSGRVLPRLWDAASDRAFRESYVEIPPDGVVLVAGALLLGRGLPFDVTVHLRMNAAARARTLPADQQWTLRAYTRYELENDLDSAADLLVLADHPDRPAVRQP
ncbi:uridine kinase [Pseudonocardia sp. GCM10023141]|uniref:uridine kinase n=1 Tax=Pseudonocardia sp. GCM10023141 TaxID=3252653 RepID=UPI0036202CBF